MTVLEAALKYCEMGMSVIPVGQDKKPLVKWEPYQKERATAEQIKKWAKEYPKMNIAIVSGAISGLTVIDCDSKEAIARLEEMLPDTFTTPMQDTPRGGRHYLCAYEQGIRNKAAVMEHVDVRSEGGYFLISPSSNGMGRAYSWVEGFALGQVPCASLPESCIKIFTSFSSYTRVDSDTQSKEVNQVKTSQKFFIEGQRDQDLFHAANCLIKGNAELEFTRQVLEILAEGCNHPYPLKDVPAKIQSAIQRAERREGTVKEEILWWLESKTGQFQVKDYYNESNVVNKSEKHAVIVALQALCKEGIIESCGNRSGTYRKVERDFTVQQWWTDEGQPLALHFPLGIEELAKVYPGNIILLEGQKSQGKSAFALEFCRMNRQLYKEKARYQNVEMSDSELIERFRNYPKEAMTIEQWRDSVDFVKRTGEWWDLILPDGLNVVDYLIEYKEAYLIADFVFKIHQRLKNGVALVVVQRDPYKPYPAGGRAVRDIPRLILSLMNHKLRLEDVKSFYQTEYGNPSGLVRKYKQIHWWRFEPQTSWEPEEEEKYEKFRKRKD